MLSLFFKYIFVRMFTKKKIYVRICTIFHKVDYFIVNINACNLHQCFSDIHVLWFTLSWPDTNLKILFSEILDKRGKHIVF